MDNQTLVIAAMAKECADLLETKQPNSTLPKTLQPDHLLWMSRQISHYADDWPATKLHRWIGYVQGGMVANRMLDFDGAREMFKRVRKAFQGIDVDQDQKDLKDLIDHLDPENPFRLEIGGEA
jgi:hypothetical protein